MKVMLKPIVGEIHLEEWFESTLISLKKLVNTFEGNPDKEWWGHILSWDEKYGSGARSCWSGWIIDFLMAKRGATPKDFQSGTLTVPLNIIDISCHPHVKDDSL